MVHAPVFDCLRARAIAGRLLFPLDAIESRQMAYYIAIMKTHSTLDKAGRIVLPKALRDELRLAPGDSLEIEGSDEQIILKPARGNAPLHKKKGIWVFRAGEPLTASVVNRTLREVREEREGRHLGKRR